MSWKELGKSRKSRSIEQFGVTNFGSTSFQEEQERELAFEIEEERDVQNPGAIQPLEHKVHPGVEKMITQGELRVPRIKREANELLPSIEKSPHVFLHMYLPRSNLAIPSLQHLKLHVSPPLPGDWRAPRDLVMNLNLFAGQTYFEDFEEYKKVCSYLGLSMSPNEGHADVAMDGFVGRLQFPGCLFTESLTAFLRYIMANVRRNRQDISRTHVGRMLAGEILTKADIQNSSQRREG